MTTTTKTKKTVKADNTEAMTTKIADGARELVKRSAATAKERTDDIYDNAKKYNSDLEDVLKRAAGGYTNILGNIAEVTYENVNSSIKAAEKLAEAKSVSEAVQIQADFVRSQSAANLEHARSAFGYVRDMMTDGAGSLRDTYAKMWNMGNKAA